ncbi:hypothetical protein CFS9_37130 [Flavobacterium sp. CFS9]|uniref:Uncharacterized protein n=1 Tax=Flavobacterium sp. CFS9 TaxID=3143118 RepID=A0AAT9H6G2_9FLAO
MYLRGKVIIDKLICDNPRNLIVIIGGEPVVDLENITVQSIAVIDLSPQKIFIIPVISPGLVVTVEMCAEDAFLELRFKLLEMAHEKFLMDLPFPDRTDGLNAENFIIEHQFAQNQRFDVSEKVYFLRFVFESLFKHMLPCSLKHFLQIERHLMGLINEVGGLAG